MLNLITRSVVPNLFWAAEHFRRKLCLAEHLNQIRKVSRNTLDQKYLVNQWYSLSFKISKIAAEHFEPAGGTLVFRGTVVGNHCSRLNQTNKGLVVPRKSGNFSFGVHKNNQKWSVQPGTTLQFYD